MIGPGQSGEVPRHVLVLDTSKSMLAPLPGVPKRKIEVAREAVAKILEEVRTQNAFFGMVVFNSTTRVLFPLSQALPQMEEITRSTQPTGKSAIWDALALGADLLRTSPGGPIVGNLV
ncbi:MAG: VWA domain-containing protein, partial [Candidatus Thermoplasmatota archaeon]|nr:VWA domain-containing protein [Candidatus Thermoplasmatota archaeon]